MYGSGRARSIMKRVCEMLGLSCRHVFCPVQGGGVRRSLFRQRTVVHFVAPVVNLGVNSSPFFQTKRLSVTTYGHHGNYAHRSSNQKGFSESKLKQSDCR